MKDLVACAPDIAVLFRGEFIGNDVLGRLRGVKITVSTEPFPKYLNGKFHFTKDSLGRFRNFTGITGREFDFIFHYDETSLSFMELMGVPVSGSFALPVATKIWCPRENAPNELNKWDLTFFGRSTDHREAHFSLLKRDYRFLHVAHGFVGCETVPYCQASRIGLNVHAENELSWEPRVQQMMACGVIVVSEPISRNDIIKPGEHFVETHSPSDTHELCRAILANPARFENIRRAGYEKEGVGGKYCLASAS